MKLYFNPAVMKYPGYVLMSARIDLRHDPGVVAANIKRYLWSEHRACFLIDPYSPQEYHLPLSNAG